MKLCEVCKEESHKYRCPKCKILYCSLNCYKHHKETVCDQIQLQHNKENEEKPVISTSVKAERIESSREEGEIWSDDSEQDRAEFMEVDEDHISVESLRKLGESQHMKSLLQNPHLRNLISLVDDAGNKDKAMEKAMHEPLFIELAEQCLKIVSGETAKDVALEQMESTE